MNDTPMWKDEDEPLIFAEEVAEERPCPSLVLPPWKVLVVDDEESIHQVTHLLLDHFEYEGTGLQLISAHSIREAKEMIRKNPDIAVILLDVVMGSDESGLLLVRYIREEVKNNLARIILRTGQPGQAPEKQVIVDYDINDYKLKTELTADKIYVTMVTALRTYQDLQKLENHKKSLARTIDATAQIYSNRKISDFVKDIHLQFQNVLVGEAPQGINVMSALTLSVQEDDYIVHSAFGDFAGKEGQSAQAFLPEEAITLIRNSFEGKTNSFDSFRFAGYFKDITELGSIIYIQLSRRLNEWDQNIIEIFSAAVNAAYMNLTLSIDMESTQREMIFALGEVAEARSQETGYHVKRVSEYARLFGVLLQMDSNEIELLSMAAPVHDIGKLTIPDAILNKPGKLSEEEFDIIKTHSIAGYRILNTSNRKILKTAALIALQHHEKWNGEGYPSKQKGQEIHLYGRIISICDVFDALSSDRVYKSAWPMDEIIAYFRQERGNHFDPDLVDIFLEHIDEFIEIKKTYS